MLEAFRQLGWGSWVVLLTIVIVTVAYLSLGDLETFVDRLWIVFGVVALISVACGIKYGSQDKFWT